ncbi:hypothetical protein [Lentzea californiensis]|uniref:hypothetical protein n=1 Tax=Lentzea californiensis TaxID=438851 RepID=UPI0021642B4F|nr:hypothetical protein [Lentzea californiensis]MCR3746069.1 hypothetical protein [Lentzea californiensis]
MGYVLDWQGLAEPHRIGSEERGAAMGSVVSVLESTWTTIFRAEEVETQALG